MHMVGAPSGHDLLANGVFLSVVLPPVRALLLLEVLPLTAIFTLVRNSALACWFDPTPGLTVHSGAQLQLICLGV